MARWSQSKRAEVRAEILQAARAVFEERGFEEATMREIAKGAGVAVGTLFNYFPDKTALLFAALHDDIERTKSECLATLPSNEAGVTSLLVHAAMTFYRHYAARPALSRTLLEKSLFATGEAGEAFRDQVSEVAAALAVRLAELQRAGRLAAGIPIEPILLAFFSHYYFILLMEIGEAEGGLWDLDRMERRVRLLSEQLLRGVGPEGA